MSAPIVCPNPRCDGGYVGEVLCPECVRDGRVSTAPVERMTPADAIDLVVDVAKLAMLTLMRAGGEMDRCATLAEAIPGPSGRLVLRACRSLQADLVRAQATS